MKCFGFLFALFLVSAIFTACSRLLQVTLFNNTGEAIELRAELTTETIAPGRFAHFKYPGQGANRVFRLSSNGCEYLYDVSSDFGYDGDHYTASSQSDRGIQIQVEKDFSMNLLPDTYAGNVPISREIVLKQKGFPLQPVSRKCH